MGGRYSILYYAHLKLAIEAMVCGDSPPTGEAELIIYIVYVCVCVRRFDSSTGVERFCFRINVAKSNPAERAAISETAASSGSSVGIAVSGYL